ncbi:hypothetical protein Bpfe_014112 [Biomphalaria pfeifferi]|uniref:TNFR-Cys domain-containing protein n=1 Tax=Biomphalaria pfeifferi TaxID=112525 RepID=A0AAD8BLE1_BIOPF|nr:hypothetical protein Bpfe_014112 [Biomphalaria pfeifferi]
MIYSVLKIKMMLLVLLPVFCVATPITHADTNTYCGFGQFRNTTANPSACQDCPPERYMDEENHVYTTCKICTVYHLDTDRMIEQEACTPEKNAVIKKCAEGFYVYNNECQRCSLSDCPEMLDCCSKVTVTPASTTSASYDDAASTLPKSPGPTSEQTKCDDIIIEATGCLGIEYENISCLEYKGSNTVILPCRQCSEITQTKVILCSATDVSSYDSTLHPGIIVAICIAVAILLGVVVVFYYVYNKNWRRKKDEATDEKDNVSYGGQTVTSNLLDHSLKTNVTLPTDAQEVE